MRSNNEKQKQKGTAQSGQFLSNATHLSGETPNSSHTCSLSLYVFPVPIEGLSKQDVSAVEV